MHTYPNDLADKKETIRLTRLIADNDVALVDTGHTHYNELATNGDTIFSAVRSTGQIEEGPVGYAFISINEGIVSSRFKQLENPFPSVIITAPSDYRLMRKDEQAVTRTATIRAIVFVCQNIREVAYCINDGNWTKMPLSEQAGFWLVSVTIPDGELIDITVQATIAGRAGIHSIRAARPLYKRKKQLQNGGDEASIGAWIDNGIFGTKLGPNI